MSEYFPANSPAKSAFVTSNATPDQIDESRELALTIVEAASDRKGDDILLLGMADVSYLADYFVLITGYSKVQIRAIAQAIEDKVEQAWQRQPVRSAGKAEGTWVLQDYGDVIVHIMMPKEREFYNLEAFWSHAEQIDITATVGGELKP